MEGERVWPSTGSPSDSLHLSPPECPLILPSSPDSQLDTPAPSEWRAALTPRNFPLLSVSRSWLEITGLLQKHSPPSHLKSLSTPFSPPSLHFFIFLIPALLLFNVINFLPATTSLPPLIALSWQEMTRKMSKRERGGKSFPSWVEPEWCHGGICPPGVEASLPLLITLYKLESDMADMRPKYNYCGLTKRYWDSGNEGETASEIEGKARARTHTHKLENPPTHKHNHLSFPSIPSDRLMLLRG